MNHLKDRKKDTGLTVFINPVPLSINNEEKRKELQSEELEKAIKRLKKRIEKEGVLKDLRERKYYKKPSQIRREHILKVRRDREVKKNRKKRFQKFRKHK